MTVQAVVIHRGAGPTHEFTPTGDGEWELRIQTHAGVEPGGLWSPMEVVTAVMDAVCGEPS